MNKSKTMKKSTGNARKQTFKQWLKKAVKWVKDSAKKAWNWTVSACKKAWRFICRMCNKLWNWLKSIDIVGMINLTLLVAIIVLFTSLIADFVRCDTCKKKSGNNVEVVDRKVVQRKYGTNLPVKMDTQTNITPKIRAVGVAKPHVINELSLPADELPQQVLSGDVIVERAPNSPILSNGVKVNGNLYIQNMRKYTIPCDAKINGHLFIRNVSRVDFCGKFKVNGNVYVNRGSSFGPLPNGTKINGKIVL